MTSRVGTPAYMAPELAQGDTLYDGNANNSIDVYSYGILLWALCTSEEPYNELKMVNAYQLMAMVVDGYRPLTHLKKKLARTSQVSGSNITDEIVGLTAATGGRPIPPVLLSLMVRCWGDSRDRPTFDDIVTELRTLLFERQRQLRLSSVVGSGRNTNGPESTVTERIRNAEAVAASSALLRTSSVSAAHASSMTQDALLLGDVGTNSKHNIRSTVAEEESQGLSNFSNHSSDFGSLLGGTSNHGTSNHTSERPSGEYVSSPQQQPMSETSLHTVVEGSLHRISDLSIDSSSDYNGMQRSGYNAIGPLKENDEEDDLNTKLLR